MAHLDRMIDAGIHGLIMLGTVGENCSLEYAEKLEVLRATVEHVAGRVPVLSGVAECTTARACRFAADAAADRRRRPDGPAGDGLQVGPARDDRPLPRRSPGRPTCRSWSTTTRSPTRWTSRPRCSSSWRDEPKLVAIKESSENVRRITDLKNVCGDRYILFCGVDDLVLESLLLGATGWVSGLVNAFPAENRLLWDLATAGRWERGAGGLSLVHAAACTWTRTSSWCSTSSWRSRNAGSARRWSGAPRLPLERRGARADPGDHPPRRSRRRPQDRRAGRSKTEPHRDLYRRHRDGG